MHYLPFPVHFVEKVPVEALNIRGEWGMFVDELWFLALCEDIDKNGMACPLLVINDVFEPLVRRGPMLVKTGQTRARALKRLGWNTAPCIIVGELPQGLEDAVRLHSLQEVQQYLPDGVVGYEGTESLRIDGALIPEQMIYPNTKPRYWKKDHS